MFTSITVPPVQQDEIPPRSSHPWIWFGFIFGITFFVVEGLILVMELDEVRISSLFNLLWLVALIYWLVCVHRIHKILAELSDRRYPISPKEAAFKHLIPFYSIFWLFKWPSELSNYLNGRAHVKIVSGYLIGGLLLCAFFSRFIDGGVAIMALYAVTFYVGFKLKQHVAVVKGLDPSKLPPLPDPEMFRSPHSSQVMSTIGPSIEPIEPR